MRLARARPDRVRITLRLAETLPTMMMETTKTLALRTQLNFDAAGGAVQFS